MAGAWRSLFDAVPPAHATSGADVLAVIHHLQPDRDLRLPDTGALRWWLQGCHVPSGKAPHASQLTCESVTQRVRGGDDDGNGAAASGGSSTEQRQSPPRFPKVLWNVIRISRRMAGWMTATLSAANGSRGHMEALTGPLCTVALPSCTLAPLPAHRLGFSSTGGWGDFARANSSRMTLHGLASAPASSRAGGGGGGGTVRADRVYHPVKCEASLAAGADALQWSLAAPARQRMCTLARACAAADAPCERFRAARCMPTEG